MKLKPIFAILLSLCSQANAQHYLKRPANAKPVQNVTSVKKAGANIKVDQMVIANDKNLDGFIQYLQTATLKLSYNTNDIPDFIKTFLDGFNAGKFTIANPGQPWNCCCDRDDNLPDRQLVTQGNDGHLLALSYMTGGIGTTQRLILIKYNKREIIDFWVGRVDGDTREYWETTVDKWDIIKFLKQKKYSHWAVKGRLEI